jgi:hypothetical protein
MAALFFEIIRCKKCKREYKKNELKVEEVK